MRAIQGLLILGLLVAVLGCGGDDGGGMLDGGGGGSATCVKSTTNFIDRTDAWDNLGVLYPNHFVAANITLTNAGTQSLSGHVSFTGSSVPTGLTYRLASGVNPDFALAPGGSITYTILLGTASNRYDPYHRCHPETITGTVNFGTACGSVTIRMHINQWDYPGNC